MPKIKTTNIRLAPESAVNASTISIEIWYKDGLFYTPLGGIFLQKYEGFEIEQLEKFDLEFMRLNSKKGYVSITEKTEEALIAKAVKFYEKELEQTTSSRKVIIIHYSSPTTSYGNHHYNEDHPQIALQLGLTYAVEFTIGDEKSYSTDAKAKYGRTKFRMWDNGTTIIDDTKENRKWLETLYAALKNVETALDTITENESTLQKFIASGKNLLGNG